MESSIFHSFNDGVTVTWFVSAKGKEFMKLLKQAKRFTAMRPKETKWTVIGGLSGVPIGLAIGGVGVAALGGGIGIPAVVFCSALGAGVGNRVGIGKDRPLPKMSEEEST